MVCRAGWARAGIHTQWSPQFNRSSSFLYWLQCKAWTIWSLTHRWSLARWYYTDAMVSRLITSDMEFHLCWHPRTILCTLRYSFCSNRCRASQGAEILGPQMYLYFPANCLRSSGLMGWIILLFLEGVGPKTCKHTNEPLAGYFLLQWLSIAIAHWELHFHDGSLPSFPNLDLPLIM